MAVVEIHLAVLNLAVRSLDKAEVVDFSKHTQRRNQTDVRALRGLNRAKTSVVGVVHVAHLKSGTVTRQTARTESRHSSLVSNLGKRVGLVHELRQCVGSEERIDNGRDCLGVDQVNRSKHLVVADVHTLTDCTRHTCKTHSKLVVELLADCAHTTVRKVVDIVDIRLRIDKLNQILDDGDDVFLSQHFHLLRHCKRQFLVDAVTAHIAQVITLLGEEKVGYHLTRARIVRWLRVAQLAIDIVDSLFFRVA